LKKLNVAVLGLGNHQLKAIKILVKNFNVFGFDGEKNPIGKKYVKKFYNLDLKKKEKIFNICKKHNIVKALSFNTEAPLKTVFYINKMINGNKVNLNLIQNKYELRKKLKNNFFPVPKFFVYQNFNNLKKFKFPLVAKPFFGAGSRGVFLAKNLSNFTKLLNKFKNNYKNKKILIEEYIPGIEYAEEGWVEKNNKVTVGAISKKERSRPPRLFDTSLIINYQNNQLLFNLSIYLKNLFKLLKLSNQVFHVEFKFYKKKIYLIDFSIRGAGYSVYSEILAKIINQNTDQILIDMFFEKKITINNSSKEIFFLIFLNKEKINIIKNFKIKKKIKKLKTLNKIYIYKNLNPKITDKNLRVGHILLSSYNNSLLKREIKILKDCLNK